jgi:ABC-type Co2+ transport system permease subunit
VGVATFVASTLGGILWSTVGPWATFAYGAACAAVAATIMLSARGGVARAGANGSRA